MSDRLREKRALLGLTQSQLAEAIGVSVMTINRWEHGKTRPDDYCVRKLTKFFDASAEELGLETPTEQPAEPAQIHEMITETAQPSMLIQTLSAVKQVPQISFEAAIQGNTPAQIQRTDIPVQSHPPSPSRIHHLLASRRVVPLGILFLCILTIISILLFLINQTSASTPENQLKGSLTVIPPSEAKVACGSLRNNGVGATWVGSNGGYNGKGYNGSTYSQCDGNYSYIQVSAGVQAIFFPKTYIPASMHYVDVWIYIPPFHAEAAADYSVIFDNTVLNSYQYNRSWSICQSNYRYWYRLGTVHIPDKAAYLKMQALSPGEAMPCKGVNASKNSSGTFAEDVAALYFH